MVERLEGIHQAIAGLPMNGLGSPYSTDKNTNGVRGGEIKGRNILIQEHNGNNHQGEIVNNKESMISNIFEKGEVEANNGEDEKDDEPDLLQLDDFVATGNNNFPQDTCRSILNLLMLKKADSVMRMYSLYISGYYIYICIYIYIYIGNPTDSNYWDDFFRPGRESNPQRASKFGEDISDFKGEDQKRKSPHNRRSSSFPAKGMGNLLEMAKTGNTLSGTPSQGMEGEGCYVKLRSESQEHSQGLGGVRLDVDDGNNNLEAFEVSMEMKANIDKALEMAAGIYIYIYILNLEEENEAIDMVIDKHKEAGRKILDTENKENNNQNGNESNTISDIVTDDEAPNMINRLPT